MFTYYYVCLQPEKETERVRERDLCNLRAILTKSFCVGGATYVTWHTSSLGNIIDRLIRTIGSNKSHWQHGVIDSDAILYRNCCERIASHSIEIDWQVEGASHLNHYAVWQ